MFRFIIILSCTFLGVLSSTLGSKCHLNAECITKYTTDIYKSIIEGENNQLDPLYLKLVEANLATVKYTGTNVKSTGFKECSVTSANLDVQMLELVIKFHCPEIHIVGLYDIHGSLFAIPVDGNGEFSVDSNTYDFTVQTNVSITPKDGKTYLHINNFKMETNFMEGVVFNFTNLFNGEKELADQFIKFVNENWKDVTSELQGPVVRANLKKLFKAMNQYLKMQPLDDIIIM